MERPEFNANMVRGGEQDRIEVVAQWTYADIPNPAFKHLMALLLQERNGNEEQAIRMERS